MSDANSEIIDQEYLKLIAGKNCEMLKTLIPVFEEESKGDLGQIAKALETSDFNELEKSAHRLKGSTKTIGAVKAADLCMSLENAAKAKDKNLCIEVNSDLMKVLETTKKALNEMTS